ncbi:MAG: TlpA family protein disulfide reductase [Actinomycetes bacterium]
MTRLPVGKAGHRPGGRWPAAVAAALLLVLVTGCAGTTTAENQAGTGFIGGETLTRYAPEERQPAPVVSGPALSGRGTVTTAAYRGKVIVINIWGSWCAPCRQEAPDLAAASKDTAKTAAFVGINIRDYRPETARAFVRAFRVPYPHIYDPDGRELLKFAGTVPPNGIPTTLVLDTQGRIAVRVVGVISRATLVDIVRDTEQGR